MANIKFYVTGTKNPSPIGVRFYYGRHKIDYRRSTSLLIDPENWNNETGKVRQRANFDDKGDVQTSLSELKTKIQDKFNKDYPKGVTINGEWLEDQINRHFERMEGNDLNYLHNYAIHYADNLPNKVQRSGKLGVSDRTIQKYRTIARKVREFESYKKRQYLINEVNMKFHRDIMRYFLNTDKLCAKTTGKYITFIKTIVRDAENDGYKVHPDIKKPEFRAITEETKFIILNEDEINRIYSKKFNTTYLDNARNWLIIGVWTGARVGDLLNLDLSNINDGFIEYTAQKTGQKITVPLHSQVEAIINRLGAFPHKISQQRYNEYIKIVCREVGLTEMVEGSKIDKSTKRKVEGEFPKWELVTSHIGRRSFATNHYAKLPTPVLMAITGHTTEKMFLNYIGKPPRDNAEVLKEFWEEQKRKTGGHLHALKDADTG